MTEPLNAWPTLAEFLDAGGDVFALYPNAEFDYTLFEDFHTSTIGNRAMRSEWARDRAAYGMDPTLDFNDETKGAGTSIIREGTSDEERFQRCRQESWEAELLADPDLSERVRSLVPPTVRADAERDLDLWLRPHPLTIGIPDWFRRDPETTWRCDGCGTESPLSVDGFFAGWREEHNYSEVDEHYVYCRSCVAAALDQYDRAREDTDA